MDSNSQKYKVFFNNILVLFISTSDSLVNKKESDYFRFSELNDELFMDWLSDENEQDIYVTTNNLKEDWFDFLDRFEIIYAAGGVVEKNGELLSIYRNKKWDLPKGKLEENEDIRSCAIREVEEETGVVVNYCSSEPFFVTKHLYVYKGKLVLKPTYWYHMKTDKKKSNLQPQIEEGIELVSYIYKPNILSVYEKKTYRSIYLLLEEFINSEHVI